MTDAKSFITLVPGIPVCRCWNEGVSVVLPNRPSLERFEPPYDMIAKIKNVQKRSKLFWNFLTISNVLKTETWRTFLSIENVFNRTDNKINRLSRRIIQLIHKYKRASSWGGRGGGNRTSNGQNRMKKKVILFKLNSITFNTEHSYKRGLVLVSFLLFRCQVWPLADDNGELFHNFVLDSGPNVTKLFTSTIYNCS